jgi:predicted GNAT family acetyltransferase
LNKVVDLTGDSTAVIDNRSASRFELALDGAMAFVDYRRHDGVVALVHAEVPTRFEGRGVGSALVRGSLDLLRKEGSKALPQCSFVRAYIQRHPEYQDLLPNLYQASA